LVSEQPLGDWNEWIVDTNYRFAIVSEQPLGDWNEWIVDTNYRFAIVSEQPLRDWNKLVICLSFSAVVVSEQLCGVGTIPARTLNRLNWSFRATLVGLELQQRLLWRLLSQLFQSDFFGTGSAVISNSFPSSSVSERLGTGTYGQINSLNRIVSERPSGVGTTHELAKICKETGSRTLVGLEPS
jgi:hypothetical protein